MSNTKELRQFYKRLKPNIVERLKEFKDTWKTKSGTELFAELVFCLLTPQSKAKNCWAVVLKLIEEGLLFNGDKDQIQKCLSGVRFKNKKSEYICYARKVYPEFKKILTNCTHYELREWLVKNIKGIGYKEASHFLRNIGLGENLAILDRHILKNLKTLKVIKEIPLHISGKKYIEIENKLKLFSKRINIPISHLDLLFWSKETGEIFK
ncbi:hypothetical protein B9J78_04530 [bacterium Unc6]|nr:hypothetical protein [bacterium Unc6]